MDAERLHRQVRRGFSVLARNGPGEFARKLLDKCRTMLGFPSEQHRRYVQRKALVDAKFDADLGLDTGGIQRLHDLTIESANAHYGTSHIASDPREFAEAFSSVDIPLEGAVFIDLGSGKGRALALALAFPFSRIVGVEFARELHRAACANVERLKISDASANRIEPVCADASTYVFPAEPLILFLFHPFDSPIMKAVARNALTSWRSSPRPVRVVYLNPRYLDDWLEVGWVVVAHEHYHAVLRPT